MNRMTSRQRNIIIGGLCAIVLLMVVGYAAFSSVLNIKGTSNITSSWNVEITNIEVFKKSSGASDNPGSPTYDNTNGLTATFNTNLTSPGDYAIYKIEVTNKGSLNAVLSSITEPTSNNSDIVFYLNKDQNNQDITDTSRMITTNDILNKAGDSNELNKGYVYVTVLYRDYEGQTNPSNKVASATVTLNFEQSSSEATPPVTSPYSGTVYSWNTNIVTLGTSTINDLESTKTAEPYYESAEEVMSASGYTFFNQYTVVDDVITEGYTCQTYGILEEAVCVQGGDWSYYNYENEYGNTPGNWAILNELNSDSTFKGASGSCNFSIDESICIVGGLYFSASSDGSVINFDNGRNGSIYCGVNYDAQSGCAE